MENTLLVSVIIPVYNAEQCLSAAVESAMAQTYQNIEIILVDDGSTDNGGELCDGYAEWETRVKVVHQKNSGPSAARNAGLRICRGDWILFLDADDTLESKAVSLLVGAAEQSGAEMVIGDFAKIKNGAIQNRNDVSLPSNRLLNMDDLVYAARLYLRKPNKHLMFAYGWGRLFKASIIRKYHLSFNQELRTFEDVVFNFQYLCHVQTAFFLKETVYMHTVYSQFASATMAMSGGPETLFGFWAALTAITCFLWGKISAGEIVSEEIETEIGHARVTLTIIQLVRMCGQFEGGNKKSIIKFIKQLVNDPETREALKFYAPAKGESRAIPLLIRLRLVRPIIWVCRYKAYKRYRK